MRPPRRTAWAGSTRRKTLPPTWAKDIRPRVLARDGYRCTALDTDGHRCPSQATDVHHIGNRDDHSLANLTSLCADHHAPETGSSAVRTRWNKIHKHKSESHPGIIDTK